MFRIFYLKCANIRTTFSSLHSQTQKQTQKFMNIIFPDECHSKEQKLKFLALISSATSGLSSLVKEEVKNVIEAPNEVEPFRHVFARTAASLMSGKPITITEAHLYSIKESQALTIIYQSQFPNNEYPEFLEKLKRNTYANY